MGRKRSDLQDIIGGAFALVVLILFAKAISPIFSSMPIVALVALVSVIILVAYFFLSIKDFFEGLF